VVDFGLQAPICFNPLADSNIICFLGPCSFFSSRKIKDCDFFCFYLVPTFTRLALTPPPPQLSFSPSSAAKRAPTLPFFTLQVLSEWSEGTFLLETLSSPCFFLRFLTLVFRSLPLWSGSWSVLLTRLRSGTLPNELCQGASSIFAQPNELSFFFVRFFFAHLFLRFCLGVFSKKIVPPSTRPPPPSPGAQ